MQSGEFTLTTPVNGSWSQVWRCVGPPPASVDGIYAVVNGGFETVDEKLNRLFEKQDVRDKAIHSLYEHKKTHCRRVACLD